MDITRILGSGVLLAAFGAVSGCATHGVHSDVLGRFQYGADEARVEAAIGSNALYTLDYLVDGHVYRFQTVYSDDLGRYFSLLFKDGALASMQAENEKSAYWSALRDCTLFPPKPAFDSAACLREFTQRSMKLGSAYPVELLRTPDEAAKARDSKETTGTIVEATVLSPILLPVALVSLPVMAVNSASQTSARRELAIKLGDKYEDIESFVEGLPEQARKVDAGNGSFYVPGGVSGAPVAAFGVQDGVIIWMDQDPRSVCGGGWWGVEDTCSLMHSN